MKRSKFSLSHYRLVSCNQGELVPIGLVEVLPGDTFQCASSVFMRVSPLVTPVMHPVHVRIHSFFVPTRIIWPDFEKFITGGPDGMDATVRPYITGPGGSGYTQGTLGDYFGVPTGVASVVHSALPFRAYAKIFNEFYRDQDLTTALVQSEGNGSDTTTNTTLQKVCWEKDYFTSARPWAQKGPAVSLPLGTTAPVLRTSNAAGWTVKNAGANTLAADNPLGAGLGTGSLITGAANQVSLDPGATGLYSDLSTATAATVNQLRDVLAIQRYEEARARYGSRYTEYLRYLGIRSSDARLQRPEYLGGGKATIQFSEVLQTAPTTSGTPITGVGSLQGHGLGVLRTRRYRRFFEEHGFVITLMSVLPKTVYTNGLPRMWNRVTKEDYYQKEFVHIGQQEILNKEIYAAAASPDGTFGYQDRYDEYRRMESSVHGEFRVTANTWHLARSFSSEPSLNSAFVVSDPSTRIYQNATVDQLYCMINHSIVARRLIPKVGISKIV